MNQDQEVPATTTDLARLCKRSVEATVKLHKGKADGDKALLEFPKPPSEEFNRLNEPLQTIATGYCPTSYPVTQSNTEEKLHPENEIYPTQEYRQEPWLQDGSSCETEDSEQYVPEFHRMSS
ncbi:uncharacterized protein LOC116185802 [Apis dorsata]|uniref:uncharacterized protein LOC116185802 n=1 Tax=Apis dorsata TaxID=7462 RepID=UPI001292E728|nr:uncharacterized protein LOC116185802 [Apis dorsata]